MAKIMQGISSFLETIAYCLKLSWSASRFYTFMRLAGRIATPICGITTAFLLKYIMDLLSGSWLPPNKEFTLTCLLGGTLVVALISSGIRKTVMYCESIHSDMLQKRISVLVMDKALSADLEFFDNPAYHDKLTAAAQDSYALVNVLWSVLECVSSSIACVSSFIVLGSSNILYGIAVLTASFPSAIASAGYTKAIYSLSLEQLKTQRQKGYLQNLSTAKQYAQDIRLFGAADWLKARYEHVWSAMFHARRKMIRKRSILTGILEVLPEIVMACIAIDVSFNVLGGASTVGDYSLYTGLAISLGSSVSMLCMSANRIYDEKLRITNIKKLDEFESRITNGTRILNDVEDIVFSNISFRYPFTDKAVLDNVSFTVKKAEKVALVGLNGSGKSTLIKLLLRYYDVCGGSIKINGVDIREYELSSLRKAFSVYFQDMYNYYFTLRDNMDISDAGRDDELAVRDAFVSSDANDILARAAKGLDTQLSRNFEDDGLELSGGQNQKVALARAFYRSHSALILDEPSSNLDPEAEHRVFEALRKLCEGKTTIFTSHRLSNIGLADRIVVIEEGKVVEQGTREELLQNPKRFAELFKYQQDKFREEVKA